MAFRRLNNLKHSIELFEELASRLSVIKTQSWNLNVGTVKKSNAAIT